MRLAALPLTLVLLSPAPRSAPAEGAHASFLIVNPSGRGNQALATGFLADLASAVEKAWPAGTSAPALTGRYHVAESDAVASIKSEAPLFALVTPGFYLAHRDDLHLEVLAEPLRAPEGPAVVHVVGMSGAKAKPLESQRLGGQLAGEPAWVISAVLAQEPGASAPKLLPQARTLESVRMLRAGDLDGVLLHDSEWKLLQETGKADDLAITFTSKPLPEGPVVSFGPPSERARAAATALIALSSTEAGRHVLQRMTLRGFQSADASVYSGFAAAFDRVRRERSP
jgi:hypothetical protein